MITLDDTVQLETIDLKGGVAKLGDVVRKANDDGLDYVATICKIFECGNETFVVVSYFDGSNQVSEMFKSDELGCLEVDEYVQKCNDLQVLKSRISDTYDLVDSAERHVSKLQHELDDALQYLSMVTRDLDNLKAQRAKLSDEISDDF